MFITLIIIKINQENYNHEFLLNISKTQPIVHHNTFKHQKVITIFHKKLSKNMYRGRIGIVIPTFGRPEFVKKSFDTLAKADLKNTVIIIVDETATKHFANISEQMKNLILNYKIPDVPIVKIFKQKHGNMYDSFKIGFDLLEYLGCSLFMTLDSDAIVKKGFIQKLLELYQIYKKVPIVVTGFLTNSILHPAIKEYKNHKIKSSIGGINMLFDKNTYLNHVRPSLYGLDWDWKVCDSIHKKNGLLVATRPSVVDHIGSYGQNSFGGIYDKSEDF